MQQTLSLSPAPRIIGTASVAGVVEGNGPLRDTFDMILTDDFNGEKTWEKAESRMQKDALSIAAERAGRLPSEIDMIFAGDLLNQSIGSTFGLRECGIPFYGLFGACSTMAESLALASLMVCGGFAQTAACGTSSHFGSAEKQFRFPLEYGGKRAPTAQWTVTGSGMAIVAREGSGPAVTHVTTGKIIDNGITDANNMGAAMAPAAVDTLIAHFRETGRAPNYYDLIVTGDLGMLGRDITRDLAAAEGYALDEYYSDCGVMIFDLVEQDVACGGSGCGCSATVLCGHLMREMAAGRVNKLLFVATGALMSPTSSMQGESIPSIAHAVAIENV